MILYHEFIGMVGCYEIVKLGVKNTKPYLPSVQLAIIMSMRADTRITERSLAHLTRLCPNTWIQINNGWRACEKPECVRSTAHDLVHAYRNACAACRDVAGPVLLLEEDAIFFEYDVRHYSHVDCFLRTQMYNVYSLGSFGEWLPQTFARHRQFANTMGFSQAIVWNQNARRLLMERPDGDVHIDVHTLSAMPLKFTYYKPLVVQLFPTTENMESWCIECENGVTERVVVSAWQSFLQYALNMDSDIHGWVHLYEMNGLIRHARRALRVVRDVVVYFVGTMIVYRIMGIASRSSRRPTDP